MTHMIQKFRIVGGLILTFVLSFGGAQFADACTRPQQCDDGNPCTIDTCELVCLHKPKYCYDSEICTVDSCDPATGKCVNPWVDCTDEDPCTQEKCIGGTTAVECRFPLKQCDEPGACVDECSVTITTTSTTYPLHFCGDANGNSERTPGDALHILRFAVGECCCDDCVCDVNDDGDINASDALAVLRFAVDLPVSLFCREC